MVAFRRNSNNDLIGVTVSAVHASAEAIVDQIMSKGVDQNLAVDITAKQLMRESLSMMVALKDKHHYFNSNIQFGEDLIASVMKTIESWPAP